MAATSDEQMSLLLSTFDQIYEDFRSGMNEMSIFRSRSNVETSRREALEISNKTLKEENERLKKLHTESLNNFVDQLEHRTKCHGLKEELKRVNDENRSKEHEHRNALESLMQKHVAKVEELENKIRSLLVEKATNEMVIDRLRQDLAANKSHIQAMSRKLDRVYSEVESKYEVEVQDLKDCLLMEQEEKIDISNKLQSLQKELVISRTTVAEKQRDTTSYRQVETLKQKLMKLRKENEILKRKLSSS
ncbi:Protein At-4/1 [Raphanus sativus]|uniref:Protein At-4/1-like n=1 Tax=Raphanus sativus TaxID=3726 RepID=A0A6J0NB80_RAPSA|nr:protein At-4/1-like [Raphanus sativus]KAJ4866626.1 Protein At-4/1 [Raphanus sativus]